MKRSVKSLLVIFAIIVTVSCKKDDGISENCSTCEGPNVRTFDVCEEDEKIFVDGEEVPELEGISLTRVIRELEANADNDETFESLSCR